MVFSSIIFLCYFFPAFLLLYFLSPPNWKNAVALLGSVFFYLWGEPRFGLLILLLLLLDYYLVRLLYYAEAKLKKILLSIILLLNLGNLVVFKYLGFLGENVQALIPGVVPDWWMHIALPIGISFITFQKISYALDVYRETSEPMHRFVDYGLYILFFPQLIAGPIIRFNEIEAQIRDRRAQETIDNRLAGLFRFVIGLAKKLLIANPLGAFVDELYQVMPEGIGMGLAWFGIVAYSLQIYFDFSGYSDMAIGIARMLGFRLPENFDFPYISQSITEFWRRWHISLSSWMRDYLYIPLGGNRISRRRTYINLWLVFLLSGLWHGASWTFVVWGLFHGAFLVAERLGLERFTARWFKPLRVAFTYLIVLMGWVFFRAETIGQAFSYLGEMYSFAPAGTGLQPDAYEWFTLLLGLGFAFSGLYRPWAERFATGLRLPNNSLRLAAQSLGILLLGLWCVLELYATDFNPFIYFRF